MSKEKRNDETETQNSVVSSASLGRVLLTGHTRSLCCTQEHSCCDDPSANDHCEWNKSPLVIGANDSHERIHLGGVELVGSG